MRCEAASARRCAGTLAHPPEQLSWVLASQVLWQVSALVPLASTLTFLDLSEVHRWQKLRPHVSSDQIILPVHEAVAELTRCSCASN